MRNIDWKLVLTALNTVMSACASVPAEYVDKLKALAAREGLTVGKLFQIMIDERA